MQRTTGTNLCPVCEGTGRLFAIGALGVEPIACPECAGLDIVPASADDNLAEPAKEGAAA